MLLRLILCEIHSGICLFELEWKWQTDVFNKVALCNLLLTLYKFSKEIGEEGVINNAIFEKTSSNVRVHKRHHSIYHSKKAALPQNTTQTIKLSCEKDDDIAVILLHEAVADQEAIQNFIKSILVSFRNQFGLTVTEMKYIFFDMVDEKVINKPMEREEVLDIFKDFSKSANELKDTYNFPPIEPPEKEKKRKRQINS